MSPKPAVLLPKTDGFVVLIGQDSAALCSLSTGRLVRKFPVGWRIDDMEADPGEKVLAIASADGASLWDIGTGRQLWADTLDRPSLFDVSFSADGRYLVFSDFTGKALVYEAGSGKNVRTIPLHGNHVISAALFPDGSKGAFMGLGGRLHMFDVATGKVIVTAVVGAGPVRYSVDGKHIVLCRNDPGFAGQLRIVKVAEGLDTQDMGPLLRHIGHIRPTQDGGFLVTAWEVRERDGWWSAIGLKYLPRTGKIEQIWRRPAKVAENRTDFDPGRMLGVSTSFGFVTNVIDLRTGAVLFKIPPESVRLQIAPPDSATAPTENDRPRYRYGGKWPWISLVAVGLTLAAILLAYLLQRRKRRRSSDPPTLSGGNPSSS